ncbi:type VI secretion system accessory protein TagJ [Paracoccaceae bacterium GXU_MW_L88]
MSQAITDLLNADALDEANAKAVEWVKSAPESGQARMTLAALSVLMGDLKRAETHATMAARIDTQDAVGYGLFRQHLRGLEARAQWWENGAVPTFPGGASETDQAAVALNVALRDGDEAKTVAALEALEALRGTRPGAWNGEAVDDLRDLDDRLPHALEAVSAGGNYLWIDLAKVTSIAFRPVSGPLDLALRPARVTLDDGAEADLGLPAIYPAPTSDAERLGRSTDFIERGGIMIGQGQRAWLAGDEMQGFLGAEEITIG